MKSNKEIAEKIANQPAIQSLIHDYAVAEFQRRVLLVIVIIEAIIIIGLLATR